MFKDLNSAQSSGRRTVRRIYDLVTYKVYAELKSEAQRTYIGMLWWIIEPVIFMLIFYFVFGVLFTRPVENFVPFLLIGLMHWHWVQATITQSSNSLIANRSIFQQVLVPKAVFPTVVILTNSIKFAVVFTILLAFLLYYDIEVQLSWLYCIPVLGVSLILITGFSFLLAAILPLLPDIRVLIDNGFRALFFLSGIFYDVESLPPNIAETLKFNPFAELISALRGSLMDGEITGIVSLFWISSLAVLLLVLGLIIMRVKRSTYAKMVT